MRDLETRELRELNRSVDRTLMEALEDTPPLRPALLQYFLQVALTAGAPV